MSTFHLLSVQLHPSRLTPSSGTPEKTATAGLMPPSNLLLVLHCLNHPQFHCTMQNDRVPVPLTGCISPGRRDRSLPWVLPALRSPYIKFPCTWNPGIGGACWSITDLFEESDAHIRILGVLQLAFFCWNYMECVFSVLISPLKSEWTSFPSVPKLRGKPHVEYTLHILRVLHHTFFKKKNNQMS